MVELVFGVSLDINGKKYRLTGRYPSPALPTLVSVAAAVLDFFNGHFGTRFSALETYSLEEVEHSCGDCGEPLQIVRPGKYQCVNPECEGVK